MDFNTFQQEIRYLTPFDNGNMMINGWAFFDTPYQYVGIANVNAVPYIVFNEEGTIYTTKNKGFISEKITGRLNEITQSEILGLPYQSNANETVQKRQNDMLVSKGVLEVIK